MIIKYNQLQLFKFYHWIEKHESGTILDDICFITEVNTSSAPGNAQCWGIEIESIDSDLVIGNGYNYHYYYDERDYKPKYIINEVSFDTIDKKQFFDWLFDDDSRLYITLKLLKQFRG